uniref:Uncharacterized protein n=1 Tax=Arundo donax TaxID=35708 RepID=A0A0A9SN88_ARUDO
MSPVAHESGHHPLQFCSFSA